MVKTCLKCSYVRISTDSAPEGECPSCGAIYSKVEAAINQTAAITSEIDKKFSSDLKSSNTPEFSFERISPPSWNVVVYRGGKTESAKIRPMFKTHGPNLLLGQRLDLLSKVEIVRDASTITSNSNSDGVTTTNVGSQIGRGIVGGVIAGPVGAIIGGGGASTEIKTKTTTHQHRNVDIYLSLSFNNSDSIVVEVFDEPTFKFLMACPGQKVWSEWEITAAKVEAEAYAEWEKDQDRRAAELQAIRSSNKSNWGRNVGIALVTIFVVLMLISNISDNLARREISKLIAEERYDEALKKLPAGDLDRVRYITDLKHKSAVKLCNEKGLEGLRNWVNESSESKRSFLERCDQTVTRADSYFEARKQLLMESLGNGALKSAPDVVTFLENNYPGFTFSAVNSLGSISIGRETYVLEFFTTKLEGLEEKEHFTLAGLRLDVPNKVVAKKAEQEPIVDCRLYEAVVFANRSQMPPDTSVADIVNLARSQGRCI